ncbi:C40 family peptidase [Mycolicibacterium mengxianglii]|uniref:C40 family peptidase n=1 Tax=Mycolicibacterium mengxianglii TaxID=2736649 RepID=UPI0018EEF126|nr:C40 family peptidase [Mycolicibacterium mengxianglii]
MGELEILSRAHQLFADSSRPAGVGVDLELPDTALRRAAEANIVDGQRNYRLAVDGSRELLQRTATTDTEFASIVAQARQDHALARERTGAVLDAARTETGVPPDSPVAQREAMRRTAQRLRAQHEHVLAARRRSRRRLALLLLLRYRGRRRARGPVAPPAANTRAGIAVRAALSRLGMPYVWGATGPDRFDCSGLVQWAYRQAGIGLDRTTYDQINNGFAVSRNHIQPGDLVFPHAGHVQLAIGNGLVVEAPHAGASVRISRLGSEVAIRRPW